MRIAYSEEFLNEVKKLPIKIQRKLDSLLVTLERNPFDPQLHVKRLKGQLQSKLSFRITRDWRVIFTFEDKVIIRLLRVRNRKDIYR